MLMGTIDPNHSISDGLRGYESNAPESLKLAMGVGAGIGANLGIKGGRKALSRIEDEVEEAVWAFNKSPNYSKEIWDKDNFEYVRKQFNDRKGLNKLKYWLENRADNIAYKRKYYDPKTQQILKDANDNTIRFFDTPEFREHLYKRIEIEGGKSNANRSRIALNRGDYIGTFHHPKTRRDFKYNYTEDDIIKSDINGFTTVLGHPKADPRQPDKRVFFNINKSPAQIKSTGVHEADHVINYNKKDLRHSFEKDVETSKEYHLKNSILKDDDINYLYKPYEISPRFSQIREAAGLKPHEPITSEAVKKGIDNLKNQGVHVKDIIK